jgi:hypothetical protein
MSIICTGCTLNGSNENTTRYITVVISALTVLVNRLRRNTD